MKETLSTASAFNRDDRDPRKIWGPAWDGPGMLLIYTILRWTPRRGAFALK